MHRSNPLQPLRYYVAVDERARRVVVANAGPNTVSVLDAARL